jgi:DNA-directed RNA polymerase specialized sigma24 family protein
MSDADLVTAIEHAYRDGYRRFLSLAVGMLGDIDRGRDAVQEAFARALRSRGDLQRAESLDAWLWHIVVNVCRVEKRRSLSGLGESADLAANGYPVDWAEVRAAIAALPERQRLVLFLRHYADLDYQTIAQVMGIERGTVAATLHAAHGKVREAVTEVHR